MPISFNQRLVACFTWKCLAFAEVELGAVEHQAPVLSENRREERALARRGGGLVRARVAVLGLALGVLCALGTAGASPWPREPGRLFVSTKANYFTTAGGAPLPGAVDPPRFERIDSDVYGEFGLGSGVTLGAKIVYGDASFYDGFKTESVAGFAEIEGSVQYTAMRNREDALSFKLTGATPTRFEEGGRPGVFSDGVDLEARALYGRDLFAGPFKLYATAEAAFRRRFGDGADQLRADILIGAEPMSRLLLLLEAQSRFSLRNEDPGGADYDVLIVQPSAVFKVSRRFAAQAGAMREVAGRNLLRGDGFFLALWTEF